MDFFSKIGDTIISASHEVADKAKEMSDVTKLQYEKKTKEDLLRQKYLEIGRMYYRSNKAAAPEGYEDIFQEVSEITKEIARLRDEIAEKKGTETCPKCGAAVGEHDVYCPNCGTKLEDIFEDEDAEEADESEFAEEEESTEE